MKNKINSVLHFFKKYGIYAVLVGAVCAFLITDIIVRKPEKKSDIIFSNGTISSVSSSLSETYSGTPNSSKVNSESLKSTEKSLSLKTQNKVTEISEKNEVQTSAVNFPIDVNKADKQQLEQINGIGESTAQKIIDYRNSVGTITNLEQLLNINGIGEKTLENLSEYLYVSASVFSQTTVSENEKSSSATKENTVTSTGSETISVQNTSKTIRTSVSESQKRKPVNINKATAKELEENLLIESELAENIIKLRNEISYFTNSLELLYAEGMTEKKLQELMPYIDVPQNS